MSSFEIDVKYPDPRKQKKSSFTAVDSPSMNVRTAKDNAHSRFVAGDQFYNYELYGSLRSGGPVTFYSMECIGLIAAVFSSVFSFAGFQPMIKPLLANQLRIPKQENLAVQRLVEIPIVLTFFFGLLTDCYPIFGLRRKAYMIIGLAMHACGVLGMALISATSHPEDSEHANGLVVALVMVLVTLTSIGCMLTYLVTHTRLIELSQREPLCERGTIQGTYLIYRRFCHFIGALFTFVALGAEPSEFKGDLVAPMIMLAVISAAPLPLILKYWEEETYSLSSSVRVRGTIFWRIIQQKAVWRVVAFVGFFVFFLGIKFKDPEGVVTKWAGASTDNAILARALTDAVMLLTIMFWRTWCINTPWRRFFSWCPVFYIVPLVVLSALVCFDAVRDRYFYRCFTLLSSIGDGITYLVTLAPLTEIIQECSEGATVGLVISLQRLIALFVNTNTSNLFRGDTFYDVADVASDSHNVRWMVLLALIVNYVLNSLSAIGLVFLPCQKLDAQQLRMYGGFTKTASTALVAVSVIFLVYSIIINSMAFMPTLACHRIAGGKGCSH